MYPFLNITGQIYALVLRCMIFLILAEQQLAAHRNLFANLTIWT